MHWFGIIAAAVIILVAIVFFYNNQKMLLFLIGIGLGVLALPFIIGLTLENEREQKTNGMFLEFSRNLEPR